jgi:ribose transport system ATP-binding protein
VDVGARHDIIDAIREAAAGGCGVVVASVDAADLAVLCDRVLVFRHGAVVAELTGDMTQDDIIHATFEAPAEPGAEQGATPADSEFDPKGVAR